ncbi:nucleotide-binding protein [Flavobacterium filum]|uniref:nucleotide-binding protein n=1 Tax=Flavobacterium filum TaxID=370974 RepID=UPI0023EF7E2E|nr:nucleotide-binding protein [Flavobacterium filum]
MAYYHIRISQKSNKSHDETKVDLNEETLVSRYINPYENGEPIIINGKTILSNDIERMRVSKTEMKSDHIINHIKAEDRVSSVLVLGGPSYEWRAADSGIDVTDDYINGAPGYKKGTRTLSINNMKEKDKNKMVFIVHGHDKSLKNELQIFLSEIGLQPIVLHRKEDEGLTIIEKFEKHSNVPYAFVLLTPDDIGFDFKENNKDDKNRKKEYRARQNVIFELGYFVGKLGRGNVCCIYKKGVTLPNDISGLIYKEVNESLDDIGYKLIKELRKAGLKTKLQD